MSKDYIDRKSLIDDLNRFAPEHYSALVDMIIRKQPTAKVPCWIPVTERLPERDAMVLAYFPDMEGTPSRIQTQKGWSVTKFCTHWMPLPEPPEVE